VEKKGIAILGSTGSIGTQTLEVVQNNPGLFSVEALTANNNAELLVQQAMLFVPRVVVIANDEKYLFVKEALARYPIEVFSGEKALAEAVTRENIHIVLTALVGYAGLLPTIEAIKAGKDIALANKETLVVAGDLITRLCQQHGTKILPVDSEHSAIYQCLAGEEYDTIEKIILTASGGPFRNKSREYLSRVTAEQALDHPNWCMGPKITIDSATLMNKGLEAIEARWLFDQPPSAIEVVIHPQSIIHSMVQFKDGSIKAQMGLPDMRLPIQYALGFPRRLNSNFPRMDFKDYPSLTFEEPDYKTFRNLGLAFEVMERGGNTPCAMNAANEVVVDAFLSNLISFTKMTGIIESTIRKIHYLPTPCYEDYKQTDNEARGIALSFIK
jgi:1-deoxy-D-xylulose-5-phosphate reductoisomerase